MISALDQFMLAAAAPGAEQLVRAMHLLEHDVAAILEMVDVVLANLPADDPTRNDLEELRAAARQAVRKTEALVAYAGPIARPR